MYRMLATSVIASIMIKSDIQCSEYCIQTAERDQFPPNYMRTIATSLNTLGFIPDSQITVKTIHKFFQLE